MVNFFSDSYYLTKVTITLKKSEKVIVTFIVLVYCAAANQYVTSHNLDCFLSRHRTTCHSTQEIEILLSECIDVYGVNMVYKKNILKNLSKVKKRALINFLFDKFASYRLFTIDGCFF